MRLPRQRRSRTPTTKAHHADCRGRPDAVPPVRTAKPVKFETANPFKPAHHEVGSGRRRGRRFNKATASSPPRSATGRRLKAAEKRGRRRPKWWLSHGEDRPVSPGRKTRRAKSFDDAKEEARAACSQPVLFAVTPPDATTGPEKSLVSAILSPTVGGPKLFQGHLSSQGKTPLDRCGCANGLKSWDN